MSFPNFLARFAGFSGCLTEALVCVLAAIAYQAVHNRALFLIAISAGMGVVANGLPEVAGNGGWAAWYLDMSLRISSGALYVIGFWLLLRSYTDLVTAGAQRGTPPNGGPAAAVGGSEAAGGPPSVG